MSHKQAKRQRQERRRRTEIRAHLAEQLRLLDKRCREFDAGDWGEAVDIATRLRVIFHPGNPYKHPSILQSLKAEKVRVLSTVEPVEDTLNILGFEGASIHRRSTKTRTGSVTLSCRLSWAPTPTLTGLRCPQTAGGPR